VYREYRQSGDRAWLDRMWQPVKKAMGYAFQIWDPDADGIFEGPQWNTYDCHLYGHNTFVSGLYLAALRAAEEMAKLEDDGEFARECRARFDKGQKKLDEELWNGEYYIQTYDAAQHKQHQYGPGCHSDQLLGQWWAHILDLGYILPQAHVRSAMQAIYKYNFRTGFAGFLQQPRIYMRDEESALLVCTWPRGGRPGPGVKDVTLYADEAWTGIEYAVAGALLYEGLVDEGLTITRTTRGRQDGTRRSPWNEVECGDHYARPMSSWTLLDAALGLRYDAATGSLGIAPRLTPRDLRAFFIGPKGWGTLAQMAQGQSQTLSLDVTYGTVELRQLSCPKLVGTILASVAVRAGGRQIAARWAEKNGEIAVTLDEAVTIAAGQAVELTLQA
jgi:non-lysosomal glucosylceramidase